MPKRRIIWYKNSMKNILITGACGGIGKAASELLIRSGYNVYGLDFVESDIPGLHYVKADLTDAESIENAFKVVSQQVDRIDAILHFAGIYKMNSLVEISEEDFIKMFNVNLFGVFRVNKTFLPLLKKGSRILLTSSELGPLNPLPFTGLYGIIKTTIEKYAFSLRMELQFLGVDVSILRPGAVKTDLLTTTTTELDKFCDNTRLYQCNAERFKRLTNAVETKNITPQQLAKLVYKFVKAKKPKYVYNINRNGYLRMLSALPPKWQTSIVKCILREKKK